MFCLTGIVNDDGDGGGAGNSNALPPPSPALTARSLTPPHLSDYTDGDVNV